MSLFWTVQHKCTKFKCKNNNNTLGTKKKRLNLGEPNKQKIENFCSLFSTKIIRIFLKCMYHVFIYLYILFSVYKSQINSTVLNKVKAKKQFYFSQFLMYKAY